MFSCGMYDYSGNWAFDSSQEWCRRGNPWDCQQTLGIGTYSPRLDRNGNSIRGIKSFKMMSDVLGLHAFDLTNTGSAFIGTFFKDQPKLVAK
jgi:glutaminase